MPPSELTVAYRLAAFARPLRTEPNRAPGRYHRAGEFEPTQYACLHPQGPWAEFLRAHELRGEDQLAMIRQRVWALRVDLVPLVRVSTENAREYSISPEQLTGDDYEPCQTLADRLRAEGAQGMIVPSAALEGTENLVLFGARADAPYQLEPVTPIDVPAAMTADRARPEPGLERRARYREATS